MTKAKRVGINGRCRRERKSRGRNKIGQRCKAAMTVETVEDDRERRDRDV